jgi:hypothetical protein
VRSDVLALDLDDTASAGELSRTMDVQATSTQSTIDGGTGDVLDSSSSSNQLTLIDTPEDVAKRALLPATGEVPGLSGGYWGRTLGEAAQWAGFGHPGAFEEYSQALDLETDSLLAISEHPPVAGPAPRGGDHPFDPLGEPVPALTGHNQSTAPPELTVVLPEPDESEDYEDPEDPSSPPPSQPASPPQGEGNPNGQTVGEIPPKAESPDPEQCKDCGCGDGQDAERFFIQELHDQDGDKIGDEYSDDTVERNGQTKTLDEVQQYRQQYPEATPEDWDHFFAGETDYGRRQRKLDQLRREVKLWQKDARNIQDQEFEGNRQDIQDELFRVSKRIESLRRELGLSDDAISRLKFGEDLLDLESPTNAAMLDFATNERVWLAASLIVTAGIGTAAGGVYGAGVAVGGELVEEGFSLATGLPVPFSPGLDDIADAARRKAGDIVDTAADAAQTARKSADSAADQGRCLGPEASEEALFGQRRVGPTFGRKGRPSHLAGRSISDVADDLRRGKLSPDDLPIDAFKLPDGRLVSANTRSLAALSEAGLNPTRIRLIEPTQDLLDRLDEIPIIPHAPLPGRRVPVTPSQSDLEILRVIELP